VGRRYVTYCLSCAIRKITTVYFRKPMQERGNIKMDLREIGWDGMDWTDVAQDMDQWRALVNTVMNLRVT
jgi:hypothetical protein